MCTLRSFYTSFFQTVSECIVVSPVMYLCLFCRFFLFLHWNNERFEVPSFKEFLDFYEKSTIFFVFSLSCRKFPLSVGILY